MFDLTSLIPPYLLALAAGMAFFAGAVKGAVGFAMPTIMISGLAAFMSAELALAALILPTLVTNLWQALRNGVEAAVNSLRRFKVFLIVGGVCLVASAQLVVRLEEQQLFLMIGIPVACFVVLQLSGWQPKIAPEHRLKSEAIVGALAGTTGGVSGVWGPPTVAYLTAIDTPKREQIRVQGVIYGLGATALFGAHLQSGVLAGPSLGLSLAMLPPALLGMWAGQKVQDRLDQARFKRLTLIILFLGGLNLIRRGLFG